MAAFVDDRVLLCGGVATFGQHGILWGLLAFDAGRHMVRLHRGVERFLAIQRVRRIEATVEDGWPVGCRWLEMLGFEREGAMRGYGENGETHIRFGRVRV